MDPRDLLVRLASQANEQFPNSVKDTHEINVEGLRGAPDVDL